MIKALEYANKVICICPPFSWFAGFAALEQHDSDVVDSARGALEPSVSEEDSDFLF